MSTNPLLEITLFHYPESIYSHRVLWYLHLRALPYTSCIQPPILPRPDLASLHIAYRRIPIAAIGNDIYCDSRLIISTLERLYPDSPLACPTSADAGIRHLFESWSIDGGLFARTVQLLPVWNMPFLSNAAFVKDRMQMSGKRLEASEMMKGRPEALAAMRQAFGVMESTFLADGRDWVLATERPTVADIDAVWDFQWLMKLAGAGALEGGAIDKEAFPKTYAYVERFWEAEKKAEAAAPKAEKVGIEVVRERLLMEAGSEVDLTVDEKDSLGLKKGDAVKVWPIDSGFNNRDRGTIIGLTADELVIRNAIGIRLHFPRWNFRIEVIKNDTQVGGITQKKIAPMRMIYHPRSPYSRKVYALAIELGITHLISLDKVVVAPIHYPGWSDNVDEVALVNPLAKLPTLVPEDFPEGIFDSRTICDFLEAKAESSARQGAQEKDDRYWKLKTLHACADGLLDARVLVTYELRIRAERGLKFDEWIEGQNRKVSRALDRLETAAEKGILTEPPAESPASAAEVAIAIALGREDMSKEPWREGRPALAKWFLGWENRKSFVMTRNPDEWDISESKKELKANM